MGSSRSHNLWVEAHPRRSLAVGGEEKEEDKAEEEEEEECSDKI